MNMRSLAPVLLLSLAATACSKVPAETPPLAGAAIGGPFSLINGAGRSVTERSFPGRWRIMYFGYTFCPDVCPTDVQHIGAGLALVEREKPAVGAKIVPVFVTVDPARDTPAVVRQFTAAFHPRMIGLTGSPQAIAAAEKAYAVYARKGATSPAGGYTMDHSRQAYLMDPAGKPVALIPADQAPRAVADEIERWVS